MEVSEAVKKSWQRLQLVEEIDDQGLKLIPDILALAVDRYGDSPAYTCLGHTITFRELDTLSDRFAGWLQQQPNLKPGDRIAIQMPNLTQYAITAYGAFKAGLVLVNVNPMYTQRELEYQFNHAAVKIVVVFDQFIETLESALPNTPVEKVVVASPFDLHPGWKRCLMNAALKLTGKKGNIGAHESLQAILAQTGLAAPQPVDQSTEDTAVLQYTGGTTGVSKPAVLTHRNLIANMLQGCAVIQLGKLTHGRERIVSPLPMYHIYAFALSLNVGVYLGLHDLLIPDPRNIDGFIKLLKKWPTSMLSGLNTLFLALMRHPDFDQIDWSGLKLVVSGGMALSEGVATEWEQRTGMVVSEGYGMTETSPIITFSPPGAVQLGTVGVVVPCTEIRVVDEKGQDRATGEEGELWVRGPQVMSGYWNFEEETAEVLTGDGWLKSGDIVSVDEEGYVRIMDRQKDMIVVSGFNVYPNEIEGVLSRHPDVTYCAAIGVKSGESGEAVKAFIVSTNPALTQEDVRQYCKTELAGYKVPKFVEFRDELPLSNVGKVLRRELKED